MAGNDYNEVIKAQALAAMLAGQSFTQVSATYGVPIGTLKSWKSRQKNGEGVATVATDKKARIGDLLLTYLEEGLTTLQKQLEVFRDPTWLQKQSASEAAVLHGVIADKQIRLLEALADTDDDEGGAGTADRDSLDTHS